MDLEDELRRLFKDDRLTVRVAPDAETAVVAGARRVRRKRIALISAAGALSLAVVVGGAFMLARPSSQANQVATQPTDLPIITSDPPPQSEESSQPSVVSSTTHAAPPTARPASPTASVARSPLGPTGYGSFRLGMTEDQLFATGQIQGERIRNSDSCVLYRIKAMNDSSNMWLSRKYGLVVFSLTDAAQTPEKITIGSTEAQIRSTYRTLIAKSGFLSTQVPGNPDANYQFTLESGKVTEITLIATQQDCVS